jgi:hypothetical protein
MRWIETTANRNGLMAGWEYGRAAAEAEQAAQAEPTLRQISRAVTGGHGPEVELADERGITGTGPADLASDEEIAGQVHHLS